MRRRDRTKKKEKKKMSTPILLKKNRSLRTLMKMVRADQYNIFRKNNARLASATTMNEISKNNKNKK